MYHKTKLSSRRTESKQVDIPGVKNIFNKNSSFLLRIAWIIAVLLCLTLSIWQTIDAIVRYFSYPAVTNVEMLRQTYLTLPSITFCPGVFVTYLYPDGKNMKPWPPRNKDWLFEEQQFHLRNYNIIAEIEYSDTFQAVTMNDAEISTVFGLCRLLSYDKPISYKGFTSFSIYLKNSYDVYLKGTALASLENKFENSLLIMLHDQSSYPLSHIFMYSRGPLKKGKEYRFELTATEFKSKSFPNKPCEEDFDSYRKCWDSFVNKKMNQIAKCKLPFVPDENANLRVCRDYETLIQEYKNLSKVYDSMWDSEANNCLKICDDVHYHLNKLQEINITEPEDMKFHLDLSDNIRQIVSKDFGYTVSQMLSDIGGSLGLFLGCSVLSILELLQSIGFHFKRGKLTKKEFAINLKRVAPVRNSFRASKRY